MHLLILSLLSGGAPFAGCEVTEKPQPGDRMIVCSSFRASASRELPAAGASAVLNSIFENLMTPGVKLQRQQVTISGKQYEGMRFQEKPRVGFFVAIPSAGGSRVISCEATAIKRCDRVLAALVTDIPAITKASAPASELKIGRRRVNMPSGCEPLGADGINCSGTQLTWRLLDEDTPQNIEWLVDTVRKSFAKAAVSKRACKVLGKATTCTSLVVEQDSGRKGWMVVALYKAGKKRWFIQCNNKASMQAALPTACDQVFEWR